ncbi:MULTISPECIES: hypothetical protein [unclassified Mesorhizobium]|uniref:hypothetical protein n=1 Tax=unclassified Mesorhizobium TaxID=325217 RepID=UPI001126B593|nr:MULTISPECIES: hypothetical protein [unclassified Mesorhizobium]TPK66286.1 hypothetical protein FJ551_09305 [Mesorhizobium sp. B2-5-1]TPM60664.1 hypothetical protein FJ962_16160 [Mesorhizobium sp. B2-1-9]TPM88005.1 hypothetical protein FJ963_03385 [Mesorhizobium sp. B2-1-4]TPN11075.1 hypothetical protein FJ971_13325 [Mesorhizobium sp. B2-1-2]UCI14718.1 hypothetical protein FJ972_07620 [Mesorhizobium sp. B2-1-1]
MIDAPKVKPVLRLIPNGVVGGHLRMTLIATPVAADDGFTIDKWPAMVRTKIVAAASQQQDPTRDLISVLVASEPSQDKSERRLAAILQPSHLDELQTRLGEAWAAIVPPGKEELWGKLLDTIHRSLASQAFQNGLNNPGQSNEVALQADGSYQSQQALDPHAQLTVKAVMPVKHGDLALLLEFERAKRVHDLIEGAIDPRQGRPRGLSLVSDQDATAIAPSVEHKTSQDDAVKQDLSSQIADSKRLELQAAIDTLAAERAKSVAGSCSDLKKPDLTVLGDDEATRNTALASHTAATWEQSASTQTNSDLDRVAQCYQAIVSSPAWSRFFGFAFDVEMLVANEVPSWISAGEFPVTFKFADKPQSVGRAWTAVDQDGWPRPDPTQGGLEGGLFLMGDDCVGGNAMPRYDAVTLDVRHATEALVRPLSGSDPQHRGFLTAGLTLLDRRRAEDVRAQVRRTAAEKGKGDIQLFAQDLVIGRRLDAGTKIGDKIEWRALGSKVVTYGLRRSDTKGPDDFAPIDAALTDIILPQDSRTGVRTLDEAIVNPSSRLTPTPGGNAATDKDVFVDEAFVTWTGAPMGVNTAPKLGPNDPVLLSFLQKQSLPEAGVQADGLAPPLRYGRGYRFGMRAVFLGGQSKKIEDAAKLYEHPTQSFTYPRDPDKKTQAPTRRCARQEAIGTPVILLPGSVLGAKINEMDFGTIQSAVLRSLPEGYIEPKLPPTVIGRPYVRANDRLTPNEIVRIIVPPQVALDDLLRAGMFDSPNRPADVALGGLRSICFGVATPLAKTKDPISSQGSFPIAMIDEQRAFGQDPTRRRLMPNFVAPPSENNDQAVRGAAIFIGRKAFEARGGPPLTPRPYYPDPYARQLILRLRRRSDGAYAGPATKVSVYDEISVYPHAMPTVIAIKKAKVDTDRASIGAPSTILTDGISFKAASGQRAQRVEVTLPRGDDFDLEAFYLTQDVNSLATHFALTETIGAYELALERSGSERTYPVADHITTGFFDVPPDKCLRLLARKLFDFACGVGKYDGAGGPIEDLAGLCSIRVAHAVNRPLAAASFPGRPVDYRIYRKAFDTSKYVPKYAIDPDFDGMPPPAGQSPDAESRHRPTGLGPTEINLTDLEKIRDADLQDSNGTHSYILSGHITFDRRTTAAIEILASCVSPRDVLIDDPARRRPPKARVAGAWPWRTVVTDDDGKPITPQRSPARDLDVYGFEHIDVKTGAVTLHSSEVSLLRIDNIAPPGMGPLVSGLPDGAEETIDLSLAHIAAQIGRRVTNSSGDTLFTASQLHVFPDSKARQLRLRLRAISRFGADFETAARWTGADGISQPVVRLRQALAPAEQSVDSTPADTALDDWQASADGKTRLALLPSSGRPAKCASLSPVPVFRFTPGTEGANPFTKRLSLVRLYLERGWFSSGEGERLGIVLLATDKVAEVGTEFLPDDRLGPIGRYITRWGGDPIREDYASLATNLTVGSFFGSPSSAAPVLVRNVAVPVQIPRPPGAQDNITVLETADILTYEPRFDVDREQWFVDLDVQAPEAPNLFIRFGVVRYQENAIDQDLRASEPVVVWSQLFPRRTLTAKITRTLVDDKSEPKDKAKEKPVKIAITATVAGPSHKGARIPQRPVQKKTPDLDLSALQYPTVRFRLMHESGDDADLRRITMGVDTALLSTPDNSLAECGCTFDVMKADVEALGPGVVYVYAEEVETFMPATYKNEPAYIEDIFDPKTFIQSGPRFAARLNLQDLLDVDTGVK